MFRRRQTQIPDTFIQWLGFSHFMNQVFKIFVNYLIVFSTHLSSHITVSGLTWWEEAMKTEDEGFNSMSTSVCDNLLSTLEVSYSAAVAETGLKHGQLILWPECLSSADFIIITPYLGWSLCCHAGSLWCCLVTPQPSLAPLSRMSRCCASSVMTDSGRQESCYQTEPRLWLAGAGSSSLHSASHRAGVVT